LPAPPEVMRDFDAFLVGRQASVSERRGRCGHIVLLILREYGCERAGNAASSDVGDVVARFRILRRFLNKIAFRVLSVASAQIFRCFPRLRRPEKAFRPFAGDAARRVG